MEGQEEGRARGRKKEERKGEGERQGRGRDRGEGETGEKKVGSIYTGSLYNPTDIYTTHTFLSPSDSSLLELARRVVRCR